MLYQRIFEARKKGCEKYHNPFIFNVPLRGKLSNFYNDLLAIDSLKGKSGIKLRFG